MKDGIENIILNKFDLILDKSYPIKKYKVHSLGIVYLFKIKNGYLVSISYEYADEFYSLSLDYDVNKYHENIYFLSENVSNTKKFQKDLDSHVRKKLGIFYSFRKDFLTIAEAYVDYFYLYISNLSDVKI